MAIGTAYKAFGGLDDENMKEMFMIGAGGLVAGGAEYFVNKEANTPVKDSTGTVTGYKIAFLHDHPYLTGLVIAVVGFILMKVPSLEANEDLQNLAIGLIAGGLAGTAASLAGNISL